MPLREAFDLPRAYRRLRLDSRDDAWPDLVGYRDYRRHLESNLERLAERLRAPRSYQASPPLGIDLPKKGFTLRPGLVPLVDDRIVYQAAADLLAPLFEPEQCVYSHRLARDQASDRMFVLGVRLWLEFQGQVEELCGRYPYVVETDITAYFEHIRHDLLLRRIGDLFGGRVDDDLLGEAQNVLRRLWHGWTQQRYKFGIPQLSDPSSFFANVYLDELDKWMIRNRHEFLRYVDDMRIFTADEPSARRALAQLIIQLREIGLYVASAKTAIRRCDDVLAELGEGRRRIDAIEEKLQSRDRPSLEAGALLLEQFFSELVSDPDRFNERHFRYCVNRFKRLRASGLCQESHDRVVREVLSRLESMPYSTDIFVDYLSLFPANEAIQDAVLGFLEGAYNVYPWQEMLLLELLIRCEASSSVRDRVLGIARRSCHRSRHPASRAKALLLWGKNGDYADRREIRQMFYDESRPDIRRAILVSVQEMQIGERDNFYRNVASRSDALWITSDYLQSLAEPIYHYYNPPVGLEVEEFYEDSDDLYDLQTEHFLY